MWTIRMAGNVQKKVFDAYKCVVQEQSRIRQFFVCFNIQRRQVWKKETFISVFVYFFLIKIAIKH